jgi:hypothetical protein
VINVVAFGAGAGAGAVVVACCLMLDFLQRIAGPYLSRFLNSTLPTDLE